ncbi:MAG: hypothetical protein MZU95_12715 [Desulfomicrobium escambiense]|nr:hypothetical protein [Desulfomicrobium escambiense]
MLVDKAAVVAGEHFVLRSYSPVATIGGGQILDPQPVKAQKTQAKKVVSELRPATKTERCRIRIIHNYGKNRISPASTCPGTRLPPGSAGVRKIKDVAGKHAIPPEG